MTGACPTPAPREPSRRVVALLLALACLPYFVGLSEPPVGDVNEALYAEPPREALETGDWLAPPWNYEPWFVRPPLTAWLTMPFYAVLGPTPLAGRLPMAFAAAATILAVYALARASGGRRVGVVAALVLAATARYWLFARQLAGDVVMTACLTGGFALAAAALRGAAGGRRRLLAAHALVALGVLAKGPVILVLYAAPLALAARLARPAVPLRALRPAAFAAALALVALPWFAYMTARFGVDYLQEFLGRHHLRRAVSGDLGGRPPWFLWLAMLGDAQPWVMLLPFAAWRAWRDRARGPTAVLAWAGILVPLVLFSVPVGKRTVYLLPCYPMLAVAVAPLLVACAQGGRLSLARWAGGIVAVVAAVCAVLVVLARANVPPDIARAGLPYFGLCAATALLMAWAARRGSGRLVVGGIVGCLLAALLLSAWSLAALTPWTPLPRFAERIVAEARPGDAAVVYATSVKSLNFYARRRVVDARNPAALLAAVPEGGRAFVVADGRLVGEVRAQPSLRVEELDRRPYFEFHFRRNVLGQGASTRDYVLLLVERRDPSASGAGEPPDREEGGEGRRLGPDR